jgi:hypothetical protein
VRLYNGVENAVSICQEAAHMLVGASAVLREDSRHTTVAEAGSHGVYSRFDTRY